MPLTSIQFDVGVQWATQTPVMGFPARTEAGNVAFGAETGLPVNNPQAVWNQLNAQYLTLNPNGSATIDCYTFTNLSGGVVGSASAALGIAVYPTGGDVTITPSAVNPLNWFFNGASTATTAGVIAYNNGCFANCRPGSDTGTTAINAGARGLLFTNGSGSATVGVTVVLIEGSSNSTI